MLLILLNVLKFIGWILIVILGLILLITLLLLFVPVRYNVSGQAGKNGLLLNANVSYLLHIISVWIIFDKKLSFKIKLFGILLGRKKNNKKAKKYKSSSSKKEIVNKEESVDNIEKKEDVQSLSQPQVDNTDININHVNDDCYNSSVNNEIVNNDDENNDDENNDDENNDDENNDDVADKSNDNNLTLSKSSEENKVIEVLKLITSDEFKEAFVTVKYRVGKLFKAVLPHRGTIYVCFGCEDAGLVGELVGFYQALYPFIGHIFTFVPVFTKKKFEANVKVRGRIYGCVLLWQLLLILLDKNCRYVIKRFIKK